MLSAEASTLLDEEVVDSLDEVSLEDVSLEEVSFDEDSVEEDPVEEGTELERRGLTGKSMIELYRVNEMRKKEALSALSFPI